MHVTRVLSVLLLGTGMAMAQQALPTDNSSVPTEPKALHSFDLKALDTSVNPCDDFYEFACGNWIKNNPIPADQSRWGRFNQLHERNQYLLYLDLKQAADDPKTPLQKKYGDFYAACMDTDRANNEGSKPLAPVLGEIAGLKNKKQLPALLAKLRARDGVSSFFGFGVDQDEKNSSQQIAVVWQGGLTMPDRSYYLENTPRTTKIRARYHDYVVTLFKLTGDSEAQAQKEAANVLTIETALAKASLPRVELRDPKKVYHPMPVSGLDALTPGFQWKEFLAGINAPPIPMVNVGMPDFFKAMDTVVQQQDLAAIKSYLRFHAINSVAPWLSQPYEQASFEFFQHTLAGQAEQSARWKRCTMLTDRVLGFAVGQDWVKQHFPPQAKQNMEQLVASLKTSLGSDIQNLPWMTEATKKQALIKLSEFRQKIGYPEHWRDYSKLTVSRNNFILDLHHASHFELNRQLNKIGKPVNEKEWGMTPPTVNAYYNPPQNDINFPAGILQPPFYSYGMDPAVNFGGIGVVIGHEMTHGFDDEGSQYDGHGNVRNWWTPQDRKAFDQRTDCEVKEYGGFQPIPGVHLNGRLTLGENTADNGGLRIAYQALKTTLAKQGKTLNEKVGGYTEAQRYFIAFAQIWCENRTPQVAALSAKTDPHSPGRFRTNGTVRNFPAFGKAFGCKVGDPMMPENACRVW
ncbi:MULTISPECIES: M13 family metallopeptidase [Acidobacterium]|uniref:Peptidase, M13 family n=1 Tax=Acidobacterium capsulatum (strain ATCC 51196 / DSM 11244 / BCRC 80197 / JCM 7670 / NBRC 15755 / NCIMB 13165 / 161) TaxID=240015 RepID=C1F4B1_ACIC5|nr:MULTISPECIES: M13 family metallopeptidase [Acidobacterium]ACO33545.1 peptidase, M13 family [Acidobacterium capsulatum ATCC 51196]HCT61738.1 M13 family peptidase [Acidobacterium sp.]